MDGWVDRLDNKETCLRPGTLSLAPAGPESQPSPVVSQPFAVGPFRDLHISPLVFFPGPGCPPLSGT